MSALLEVARSSAGFQMQSYRSVAGVWEPMEDGAGRKVWLPRKTREEAVHKCLEWTGLLCIPAMRVVDLATGDVIWQDRWEKDDDDRGLERIVPDWAEPIYDQVRAEYRAEREREAELVSGGVTTDLGAAVDEVIRDLRKRGRSGWEGSTVLFEMGDFDG